MKRILLSTIVIASLLTAFACQPGGGGDKVKIGVFMSMTGDTANFGIASTNGIKMAADEVNAAGGVNEILGEVASSRSIAAAPIAQNAKIPMLTPSSTNPEVTKKGDYIFRSCFIDPVQGAAIAQFAARTLNAKRAAIMVDRKNDYSTGLEKFIGATFTKLGGEMIVTQSYQAGDQDFNAQITSIKGANPDVIFVPGYYGDVALIAKQARDKGLMAPLVGGDGWDSPSLYQIGGSALDGCYFTNHYSPYDTEPRVQKFVKDYRSRYGTLPDALAATG